MRRLVFIITALLLVSAAGLGIRSAPQPPVTRMLVPGATDIHVLHLSAGEQVITYRAPGPAYSWRAIVARNLAEYGWTPPAQRRTDMPSFNYTHISSFWFGAILDRADLDGEPNIARIRVRRWVKLPCVLVGPVGDHTMSWLMSCSAAWDAVGLEPSAMLAKPAFGGLMPGYAGG